MDLKLSCASFWQLCQSLGLRFDRPESEFWVRLGSLWRHDLGGFSGLGRVDISATILKRSGPIFGMSEGLLESLLKALGSSGALF